MNRLPPQTHHWINRDLPVRFTFEGRDYQGFQGDVLSSALWAEGCKVLGRSFKYHRPRGIYSLAGHDANTLVDNGTQTNLRGDQLPIEEGLRCYAVNTRGGLQRDRLRWMEWMSRFLPVGFYYKAFHTPRRLFPFFERQMRKVAGLGQIHRDNSPQPSPKDYDFCDLLVVGSGPAGLSASAAAAECGLKVLLVEEQPLAGGSLCWQWTQEARATTLLADARKKLDELPDLHFRNSTQVAGCYADHWYALTTDTHMTKLRARAVVIASGAIEQPAVFQNNDLPGVMLASAAQRLMHQFAVKPCDEGVIITANSEGYNVAAEMAGLGIRVAAIVDLREESQCRADRSQVEAAGIPVFFGHGIHSARAGRGKKSIRGVRIAPRDHDGNLLLHESRDIRCDGVLMSVGWHPNAALVSQAGGRFTYSEHLHQLVPCELPAGVFLAGRVAGVFPLESQLEDGRRAGLRAAKHLGADTGLEVETQETPVHAHSNPFPFFSHKGKKNFVDLDEDVHLADIENAHQEGYDNVELLKRYTTIGMGPSQGKLSNFPAVRVLARLNDASIDETGTTTSRPFYQPVPLGHLAGRRFYAQKRTPLDAWHRDQGAVMVHTGGWLRPEYYRSGQQRRANLVLAEAESVRNSVGIIDVSTLGKIHVCGPDAAAFVEQIYTGRFQKQRHGTLRYAVACDESGVIIEDGIVARMHDDHFYLSATSSGVDAFYRNMKRWALQLNANVTLSNVTSQSAAFNLAGPCSRNVLQSLTETDLSSESSPYLSVRSMLIAGIPALVMRVGFVGELGFEIHLPASQARYVWQQLIEAGQPDNIHPFGVEAQRLLRLEKGHLIVGHDTDALTTPREADVEWAVADDKPFFVGGRSLQIIGHQPKTRQLAGFQMSSHHQGPWPEECHLVYKSDTLVGRVTSIQRLTTLGHPLGMMFISPELSTPGTELEVRVSDGRRVSIEVAGMPFYDPENSRQTI